MCGSGMKLAGGRSWCERWRQLELGVWRGGGDGGGSGAQVVNVRRNRQCQVSKCYFCVGRLESLTTILTTPACARCAESESKLLQTAQSAPASHHAGPVNT